MLPGATKWHGKYLAMNCFKLSNRSNICVYIIYIKFAAEKFSFFSRMDGRGDDDDDGDGVGRQCLPFLPHPSIWKCFVASLPFSLSLYLSPCLSVLLVDIRIFYANWKSVRRNGAGFSILESARPHNIVGWQSGENAQFFDCDAIARQVGHHDRTSSCAWYSEFVVYCDGHDRRAVRYFTEEKYIGYNIIICFLYGFDFDAIKDSTFFLSYR